jgi:site-specific DNA-methyltransferase (cytosine-N4-specific)
MTFIKLYLRDSRKMDIEDKSVHLVVCSPPYPEISKIWKEMFESYGCYTYDEKHDFLEAVWRECYRVLIDGGICCINIGDATSSKDGNFQLYPNHSRILEKCIEIGFTVLPYILWKKQTNKPNSFLGSGLLPPNAYITIDCEFILILRKGCIRRFEPHFATRYESVYTIEERNKWFSQIWSDVPGVRQEGHNGKRLSPFPEEIAYRLIRMFSIIGDTVLDPFVGTGTTLKVARTTHRNGIGYEINKELEKEIKRKVNWGQQLLDTKIEYKIYR